MQHKTKKTITIKKGMNENDKIFLGGEGNQMPRADNGDVVVICVYAYVYLFIYTRTYIHTHMHSKYFLAMRGIICLGQTMAT